jgi:hypothetical protein
VCACRALIELALRLRQSEEFENQTKMDEDQLLDSSDWDSYSEMSEPLSSEDVGEDLDDQVITDMLFLDEKIHRVDIRPRDSARRLDLGTTANISPGGWFKLEAYVRETRVDVLKIRGYFGLPSLAFERFNLTELYFTRCGLTEIPLSVLQLENLRVLCLEGISLSSAPRTLSASHLLFMCNAMLSRIREQHSDASCSDSKRISHHRDFAFRQRFAHAAC